MKKPHFLVLILGLLLHPTLASAEDQALVSTARELAKQALQAYDEGRYEEAAENLGKAYHVVRVPTLALNRARALVKLGKLVQASELYLEATRLPHDPAWPAVQDDAISSAARERGELLPRIPRLKLSIEGADPGQVVVKIDERHVPSIILDAEQMVDPGPPVVMGKYGQQTARELVAPKEGERLQVALHFTAAPKVTPPDAELLQPPDEKVGKSSSALTALGWTGVGLGGAGLVFGVIEGLSAKSKGNELKDTGLCSSNGEHCPRSLASDVDSYERARMLSTLGLYAGGILTAVGVTLLVLPAKKAAEPRVGVVVGPSFIGVKGELL